MSFVVVYLIRAREIVVVPDNWVQDLNKAKLKNYGANSNQNFLLYWSAKDGKANLSAQPNFDAKVGTEYRDTIDEICYYCRIKKLFGEYSYLLVIYVLIVFLIKTKSYFFYYRQLRRSQCV